MRTITYYFILCIYVYLAVPCCAKLLQLCLTLCDARGCSSPGFSVYGVLQARKLEPFPSPGDLPHPGIKLVSAALAGRFFTTESPGRSIVNRIVFYT